MRPIALGLLESRLSINPFGIHRDGMNTQHEIPSSLAQEERDQRLADLWCIVVANPASERHATELYLLIRQILAESRHFSIPDAMQRDSMINAFFLKKVLEPASLGKQQYCFHAGALRQWFGQFLVTEWRKFEMRRADNAGFDEDFDSDDFVEVAAASAAEEACDADCDTSLLLSEAGLDEEAVRRSADRLVDSLEGWAHLYLAEHLCPPEEERQPLDSIARTYQIPSYHARARRLGITRKKDGTPADYEKSIIGSWLASFTDGCMERDQQPLYALLFNFLCRSVFSREVPSCP